MGKWDWVKRINQSRRLHLRNREIVIEEILALHEACQRGMSWK